MISVALEEAKEHKTMTAWCATTTEFTYVPRIQAISKMLSDNWNSQHERLKSLTRGTLEGVNYLRQVKAVG